MPFVTVNCSSSAAKHGKHCGEGEHDEKEHEEYEPDQAPQNGDRPAWGFRCRYGRRQPALLVATARPVARDVSQEVRQ